MQGNKINYYSERKIIFCVHYNQAVLPIVKYTPKPRCFGDFSALKTADSETVDSFFTFLSEKLFIFSEGYVIMKNINKVHKL